METEPQSPEPNSSPPQGSRLGYALLGVIATGAALAASELVAGIYLSAPSLIRTIGQRFIDLTPSWLEDWAISTFGTNDKLVLIIGIVVASLAIGAYLGVLSKDRLPFARAGFLSFGVVGFVVGLTDPLSRPLLTGVAAAAAAITGIVVVTWLGRLLERSNSATAEAGSESRRVFLSSSGASVILSVGAVLLGRYSAKVASVAVDREQITLPSASEPVAAPTTAGSGDATTSDTVADPVSDPVSPTTDVAATDTGAAAAEPMVSGIPDPTTAQTAPVEGVSSLVTPNEEFYVIDTALSIPAIDLETWTLTFTGAVDTPFSVSYEDLLAMPMVERYVTLCCVSNSVGGGLVGNAKWLGVPLRELVERAGVTAGGTQLIGRSVDGFTVGFPTSAVYDGREALVAVGMNGEPLPLKHGFPARLVVSGLYGYVSATKWLSEIEFAGWEDFDAYWIPRGWAKEAPIKTQSRIDTPKGGRIGVGMNVIAGVAWAQSRGVDKVEVQIDNGPWREATLPEELSIDSWRQWYLEHDFTAGPHTISVRATDSTGETQTAEINEPRPDGATGYHMVRVDAA